MKVNQNRNQRNYMIAIVFLVIAIFMLFMVCAMIVNLFKGSNDQKDVELSYDNLTTVKQVIEYYKSTYISEETSLDNEFNLDIYLKFAKLPYDENDNSNEKYYSDIINEIAKILRYKSFKMIDEENKITVKVICSNTKNYNK